MKSYKPYYKYGDKSVKIIQIHCGVYIKKKKKNYKILQSATEDQGTTRQDERKHTGTKQEKPAANSTQFEEFKYWEAWLLTRNRWLIRKQETAVRECQDEKQRGWKIEMNKIKSNVNKLQLIKTDLKKRQDTMKN